ncbi:MAG TPA: hypothetical protein VEH49_05150 [Methylomirabilota bacterium]|nr:hypothetical protein [Methylomirabilota bacterium]
MKAPETRYVEQSRAAALLGIPESDLCAISTESGIGHKAKDRTGDRLYFTYEELRSICQLTLRRPHQTN